jgi:hypothetical protein
MAAEIDSIRSDLEWDSNPKDEIRYNPDTANQPCHHFDSVWNHD